MTEPDFIMVEMDILGVMRPVRMERRAAVCYLEARAAHESKVNQLRLEAEAAVRRWAAVDRNNDIALMADSLGPIRRYFVAVGSGQRTGLLLGLLEQASTTMFWALLREAWSACDGTWPYRDRLLRLLRKHTRHENPHSFLHDDEQRAFDDLPDPINVYRGCSRMRIKGLSWTVDLNIAAAFARGNRGIAVPQPVIASGQIPKSHVFAYYTDRHESELLIDPRHVAGLRIKSY